MRIDEFFDVFDREHLRAYDHLVRTGQWPEGFIPEGTTFPNLWTVLIANQMAAAWIVHFEMTEACERAACSRCPWCLSPRVDYAEPDFVEGGGIEQKSHCTECGKVWISDFQIADVRELCPTAWVE